MKHRPDDDEDEPYVVIERRGSGATSFLVGLAVGAGIALLFAPQSGEETRRQLKRRARRAANVARDAAGDLSENVVDRYEQAKRTVEDRLDSARQALEIRKHQAAEAFRAGREAAQQARLDLEARIAQSKANYRAATTPPRVTRRSTIAPNEAPNDTADQETE
ncbi:MAG TPA: YtxH domain-containing protein [Gemmatimonadaceae bacterium]|jgi:gas vesicle protein